MLNQASVLLQLSSDRSAQIKEFIATAAQLASAQQMARRTEQGIATLEAQRLSRKKSIGKTLDKQKSILATLTAAQQQQVTSSSLGGSGTTSATDPIATNTQAGQAVAYRSHSKRVTRTCTAPPAPKCVRLLRAGPGGLGVGRGVHPAAPPTSRWRRCPRSPPATCSPATCCSSPVTATSAFTWVAMMLIDAPQTGQYVEKVPLSGWYSANLDSAARP